MQLKIQYYALMREQAGRSEETLETGAATPTDLYGELAPLRIHAHARPIEGGGQQRVQRLVAPAGRGRRRRLHSTRGGRLMRFRFTQTAIDTAQARRELLDPAAGGYASFEGWVRESQRGARGHRAGI